MADDTKTTGAPQILDDDTLDTARGGVWLQDWINNVQRTGPGASVNAGGGWDHTLTQPTPRTDDGQDV